MTNYNCPRCNYNTKDKTRYVNHLKRKKICNPIFQNINLDKEYEKYNINSKKSSLKNESKIPQKTTKLPQNTTFLSKNTTKLPQNTTQIIKKGNFTSKNFICGFCDKEFSRKDSLSRHLKGCQDKLKDDENKMDLVNLVEILNLQIEQKDKELEKRNNQIDELIKKVGIISTNNVTNNIQQNIQQNIKLLAYKNTDLSHLEDSDYLKCLNHSNFCIPYLIEKIHFDPTKPQNHNIYISNLKNNYVMVYDGDKWTIKDREESIQNLIEEKEHIIEQKLEEWIENGDKYPDIMKKFNRYIDKKENDKVLNKIKNEIRLMLFNNRGVIANI